MFFDKNRDGKPDHVGIVSATDPKLKFWHKGYKAGVIEVDEDTSTGTEGKKWRDVILGYGDP